jgi:tetratricopeptide (TPR) repeat protein
MMAAPGYGDLLTGLLPQGRKLLIHLLTCNDCRQGIVPDLLSEQLPGLIPDSEEWSVPQEPQTDDAAEPAAALAELLGRLPEERAALLAEERFHKISLLDLLLQTGREGQVDNPELAEHLASLAGQLAGLIPEITDRERQAAYLTRAAVLESNARRLAGNLKEADRPFAHAPFYAAPPAEQARFQRALALIRWEQGRFDEADSLLAQAARNFVGARLLTEEGATLILLGLFEAERGLFPLAAFHLLGGLAAVDGRERPWLFVRGGLAMALSMAEQGGKPHAVELLNRLRKLYPHVQDPAETIRLYWLEGQLRARLGDVAQARELLVSVRRKYLTQLQLHEAVLATLALAAVPVPGKQPEESRQLSDELEERFPGAQGLGEILRTLRQQSVSPLQATLPKAAEPLRELLIRNRHYAQPLPFA